MEEEKLYRLTSQKRRMHRRRITRRLKPEFRSDVFSCLNWIDLNICQTVCRSWKKQIHRDRHTLAILLTPVGTCEINVSEQDIQFDKKGYALGYSSSILQWQDYPNFLYCCHRLRIASNRLIDELVIPGYPINSTVSIRLVNMFSMKRVALVIRNQLTESSSFSLLHLLSHLPLVIKVVEISSSVAEFKFNPEVFKVLQKPFLLYAIKCNVIPSLRSLLRSRVAMEQFTRVQEINCLLDFREFCLIGMVVEDLLVLEDVLDFVSTVRSLCRRIRFHVRFQPSASHIDEVLKYFKSSSKSLGGTVREVIFLFIPSISGWPSSVPIPTPPNFSRMFLLKNACSNEEFIAALEPQVEVDSVWKWQKDVVGLKLTFK